MNKQVQKMLDKGVIIPSHSPWSSPVVLVPKKSESGIPKYRFCVDFRALNAVTKYDSYPLPQIEETTSTLSGSRYFSVLDLYSGFRQINIHEPHREKTAFSVPSLGHYEFTRLPYGLCNSPASFQRLTLRQLMSYIYMEHPFLMFLDHTQRRSTVGRTPLDE